MVKTQQTGAPPATHYGKDGSKQPGKTKRYLSIKDIVKQVCEKVKYCLVLPLAKTLGCISLNL